MISQHAADVLARRIVDGAQSATELDIEQIVQRIATAPFEPREVTVPPDWRGLFYLGRELGPREPSLFVHLFTRVVVERQWMFGTTAEQYLADVRGAVGVAETRIAAYRRRGGAIIAALAETERVVAPPRRGIKTEPYLLVVYSADRGIIVSGYQASGLETLAMPGDARWLK